MYRQHDRGLDVASMNVERLVRRLDNVGRHTKAGPAGRNDKHVEADAGLGGDDCQQWRISAVSVEQHQAADAAIGAVRCDADPAVHRFLEAKASRT